MINYLLYRYNGMTTGIMAQSPVRLIDNFLLIINKNDMTFNSYKSIINHQSSSQDYQCSYNRLLYQIWPLILIATLIKFIHKRPT